MRYTENEHIRLRSKYGPGAVITGATSGIGLEIATRLAEAGFDLLISGRNQQRLDEVQRLLEQRYKVDVYTCSADLAQKNDMARFIEACEDMEAGLFVASAGFGTSGSFSKSNLDEELDMLSVNCSALLILTHYFANRFKNQKRGGIVLLSSLVAFQGTPFSAHYAATKAYVQSLGEAIAEELRPYHVDVLTVAPGPVETGFGRRANMKMSMSLTPEQVGIPILRALGRQSTVLPGMLSKVLIYALRTVPRWAKVKIMAQIMGGMTKHQ